MSLGVQAFAGGMISNADAVPLSGGTLTNVLYFVDGTSSLPGAAFAGAHGTGMYRAGTTLGFAIAGTSVGTFVPGGIFNPAGPIYLQDGIVTAPGLAFAGAHGTGMWLSGTTLAFSIAGTQCMAINAFGTFVPAGAIGPSAGAFYFYQGAAGVATITDVADTNSAPLRCALEVVSPGASNSPGVAMSRQLATNAGAGSEFVTSLHASCPIGFEYTLADVGGTGGIAFVAPTGESIRVGLAVTSSTNRKVASATGAGAILTLVKMTSTLWMAKDGFTGVWTGS